MPVFFEVYHAALKNKYILLSARSNQGRVKRLLKDRERLCAIDRLGFCLAIGIITDHEERCSGKTGLYGILQVLIGLVCIF